MPRYNKIFAGGVSEPLPQTRELPAAAAILPGCAVVISGSTFALATATTAAATKVYVAEENYITLKNVDVAYATGETVIGLDPLDEQLFYVRVPTGQNVLLGSPLSAGASGKFVLATTGRPILFVAEEAFNNNTGADQLVRARAAKSGGLMA